MFLCYDVDLYKDMYNNFCQNMIQSFIWFNSCNMLGMYTTGICTCITFFLAKKWLDI